MSLAGITRIRGFSAVFRILATLRIRDHRLAPSRAEPHPATFFRWDFVIKGVSDFVASSISFADKASLGTVTSRDTFAPTWTVFTRRDLTVGSAWHLSPST